MKTMTIAIALIGRLFVGNVAHAVSVADLNAAQESKAEQLRFQAEEATLLNTTLDEIRQGSQMFADEKWNKSIPTIQAEARVLVSFR